MSSTGSAPRLGGAEDFFVTPSWTVRRLLEDYALPGGLWLEPGAGNGQVIRAVRSVRDDVRWIAVELREEEREGLARTGAEVVIGDFLADATFTPAQRRALAEVAVVIGNPPFSLASAFIARARQLCPKAIIVLQLRLNFVGSDERADFMRESPPDIRSLPNRPSYALRETDSVEYAWLIWPPGSRSFGSFRVLAKTSLEERQGDMPVVVACEPCVGMGYFDKATRAPVPKKAKVDKDECHACYARGKIAVAWPIPRRPFVDRLAD